MCRSKVRAGEAASECGESVPRLQIHTARLGGINYWMEEMSSVTGLQLCPRTVITTRLRC